MAGIGHMLAHAILTLSGFSYYPASKSGSLGYYHRGWHDSEAPPVVFVHGIGTLWLLLLHLIWPISKGRSTFLVELPGVTFKPKELMQRSNPHEAARGIKFMLEKHSGGKASQAKSLFVGHSLGTIVLSWVSRYHPEMIGGLVFIDPITFLLSYHDICHNFLYGGHTSIPHKLIYYLASSELGIASTLQRGFWWESNNIFCEELPDVPIHACLSGRDSIVPSALVKGYLKGCTTCGDGTPRKHPINVIWHPDMHHAQILLAPKALQGMIQIIKGSSDRTRRGSIDGVLAAYKAAKQQ